MKTKIYTLTLALLYGMVAFGQPQSWIWARGIGGTSNDLAKSVATDRKGNVFFAGCFESPFVTAGLNKLYNAGSYTNDIVVVKYNAAGDIPWARCAGGDNNDYASSACTNDAGDLYVAGYFTSSSITFGSVLLTNTYPPYGDLFMVKYDSEGNVKWGKSATSIWNEAILSICADNSGNIIATGYFQSPSIKFGSITLSNKSEIGTDIFVVKYDLDGNVLWAVNAGGTGDDQANAISADPEGNIFLTGQFTSPTFNIGSIILNNTNESNDMFIAKYDGSGNVLWASSAGGTDKDYGTSISADAWGNAYACGSYKSESITFGNKTFTNSGPPYGDLFIVKYDQAGNVRWAKSSVGSPSSDGITAVAADNSGGVYVTGPFQSTSITFGSNTLVNSGFPNQDIFIARYFGTNGNVNWGIRLGNSLSDIGLSLSINYLGYLFVGGQFLSPSIDFGPYTLTNNGSETNDIFVAELAGNVGVDELNQGNRILISPNPFSNQAVLQTDLLNDATLTVTNCYGQTVKQVKNIYGQKVFLHRDQLSNGLYFLRLTQEDNVVATGKVIITD